MAGRFPLYTDANVRGPLVEALRKLGWDVVRAVDIFPEKTSDPVHFEYAARVGRVFVTNDQPAIDIAYRWLREGRRFRGMVTWPQLHYQRMRVGDLVDEFEAPGGQGGSLRRLSDNPPQAAVNPR